MSQPKRILAVDPGTKRIGIALSDGLGLTAQPLEVWASRGLDADAAHVRALCETHEVDEVVVGLPFRQDGSESPSTQRARRLLEAIAAALPELPVGGHDETLTTWEAEQRMDELGIPPRERKAKVDAFAAACLLEEVLETRRS